MTFKKRQKRLPLKTVYYTSFLSLIVIPIIVVLLAALFVLHKQFKMQAIENINKAQEAVIAELVSDINSLSMRFSHLINANNNQFLHYAAGADTSDWNVRYAYEQNLNQIGNIALEPIKNIISVNFYMKSGREIYIKNQINRTIEETRQKSWYQKALEQPNIVCVGSYDTKSINDLFQGGKKDLFVLIFSFAPDVSTDRSQKIEVVSFYQSSEVSERIKTYNRGYLAGKNKLGIMQIRNEQGELIFATEDEMFKSSHYTCVKTPIAASNVTWYIESYIETKKLTEDYWRTASVVLGVATFILILFGYYSRYFLRSIVKPIEDTSRGLKEVEEGNLNVHIAASGQYEVRSMIHQFNAMVRRLNVLIQDYEEKVKGAEKSPQDYLSAMLRGDMTPEEVNQESQEFFAEHYAMLGFYIEYQNTKENLSEYTGRLTDVFEHNPRFASRCILHIVSPELFLVFYRIAEENYEQGAIRMIEDLQEAVFKECEVYFSACLGEDTLGYMEFMNRVKEIERKMCLRHLQGQGAIINLNQDKELWNRVLELSEHYQKLAEAIYIADEKNMIQGRELLYKVFDEQNTHEVLPHIYATILAIANQFKAHNSSLTDVFGQPYDYIDKVSNIVGIRNVKLWMTNYIAWIMDYSASKLNITETDIIIKAKRYIADHCETADLSLSDVAEHVGLNEKYFTNRFTKETGETFSSYLTGLRIQKAKELLKTTTYKVYEIAEMVGYHNVEHFTRMFKKNTQMSPLQYRKSNIEGSD